MWGKLKAPLKQRCIKHFANCSGNEKNDLLLRFFITCYEFVSITYISAIQNPSPKNKKIKNCSFVIKNFLKIFPWNNVVCTTFLNVVYHIFLDVC